MDAQCVVYIWHLFVSVSCLKTEIIPIDYPVSINCTGNKVVSISNITVEDRTNESGYLCDIIKEQHNEIKDACSNKESCIINVNLTTNCLGDFGKMDFQYLCKDILPYSCSFEKGLCDWYIPPASISSPWHQIPRQADVYLYTKPTSDKASYLRSSKIKPSRKQCLSFWFYLFPKNTLLIYLSNDDVMLGKPLWSSSPHRITTWYYQYVNLPQDGDTFYLNFKATSQYSQPSKGGVYIDDIVIVNRNCTVSNLDCNFENGLCGWKTHSLTKYTWKMNNGPTDSEDTGPNNDHSTGLGYGFYVYLEASHIDGRPMASLTSPKVGLFGETCFVFWYHMYGSDIGQLNVFLSNDSHTKMIRQISGNQESEWIQSLIDLREARNLYHFVFEGTRGNDFQSDMAIDDVLLFPGTCFDYQASESHLTTRSKSPLPIKHTDLNVDDTIRISRCSKYYIEYVNTSFTFKPNLPECQNFYKEINNSTKSVCEAIDNSNFCQLDISNRIHDNPKCFHRNRLMVEYTCEVKEQTKSPNGSQFTLMARISSFTQTHSTVDVINELTDELSNVTTIGSHLPIIGVIVSVAVLALCVIVIVVIIRLKTGLRKRKSDDDDPCCTEMTENTNNQGFANTTTEAGVRISCVFPKNEAANRTIATEKTSKSANKSKDIKNHIPEYAILDPNQTGYNRIIHHGAYELATPIVKTDLNEDESCFNSDYSHSLSNTTDYDTAENVQPKEDDMNVYSHTVDGVYDTTSHTRENLDDVNYGTLGF